jgi:PhzF family phenazine biosynthesis protein
MGIEVEVVHAFTDDGEGGNPAGIVFDAHGLPAARRQAIARAAGLSETAFVSRSTVATRRLEFFTPNRQIAHCGHATVAVFDLLRQRGELVPGRYSKETIDGLREIVVEADAAYMGQTSPRYDDLAPGEARRIDALRALGIDNTALLPGHDPVVADTGNRFLLLPLREVDSLAMLRPDAQGIAAVSDALDLIGFYPFVLASRRPGRHATARMFAPRYGIAEESGTGMAAGPLAAWLCDRAGLAGPQLRIEQGHFMQPPAPSVIEVRLQISAGRIGGLLAGGRARAMRTIRIDA